MIYIDSKNEKDLDAISPTPKRVARIREGLHPAIMMMMTYIKQGRDYRIINSHFHRSLSFYYVKYTYKYLEMVLSFVFVDTIMFVKCYQRIFYLIFKMYQFFVIFIVSQRNYRNSLSFVTFFFVSLPVRYLIYFRKKKFYENRKQKAIKSTLSSSKLTFQNSQKM